MSRRVLIALVLAGCGVSKGTYQKAVARIGALESELETERRASAAKAAQQTVAQDTIALVQADAAAKEKAAMAAALDDQRRAREAAEQRVAAYQQQQQTLRSLVDSGKVEVVVQNGQLVLKHTPKGGGRKPRVEIIPVPDVDQPPSPAGASP